MCTLGGTLPLSVSPSPGIKGLFFDKGNQNFFRLQKLLIDGGRDALLDVFNTRANHSGGPGMYIKSHMKQLKLLRGRNVITNEQWALLDPVVETSKWDISLLCLLFRNIGQIPTPLKGWDPFPDTTDHSLGADIVRLRHYRNKFIGHAAHTRILDPDFNVLWTEISLVILRLSNNQLKATVSNLYNASFDISEGNRLANILSQWLALERIQDFDSFATSIFELNNRMTNLEQLVSEGNDVICSQVQTILLNFETRVLEILKDGQAEATSRLHKQLTSVSDETLGAIIRIMFVNKKEICDEIRKLFADDDIRSLLEKIIDNMEKMVKECALSFEAQRELQAIVLAEFEKVDSKSNRQNILSQEHYDLSKEHYKITKDSDSKLEKLIDYFKSFLCIGPSASHDKDTGIKPTGSEHTVSSRRLTMYQCKENNEEASRHIPIPLYPSSLMLVGTHESSVEVIMSCGHEYKIEALNSYCTAQLQNGEEKLQCYKCNAEWTISEVRSCSGWTEKENQTVEMALSMNFINKNQEIKRCPSCMCFSTRENPRNRRVICRLCSTCVKYFEFCWECQRQWKGFGTLNCGNVGCLTSES